MEWKIERIRDRCAACSRPFAHDQAVLSVVDPDAGERLARRDLCAECGRRHGERAVWWETRFQQQATRRRRVDFDRLLRIFEAWQKAPREESTERDALLYLITLLLVRKRYLRMVDLVSEGGREFLRLRKPGATGEWYLAPAPLLAAADLPPLRVRLEDLIDGSFEDEEMPATTDRESVAES